MVSKRPEYGQVFKLSNVPQVWQTSRQTPVSVTHRVHYLNILVPKASIFVGHAVGET